MLHFVALSGTAHYIAQLHMVVVVLPTAVAGSSKKVCMQDEQDNEEAELRGLKGLKVKHTANELMEGETMILTLADKNILDDKGELDDEDQDELENVLAVRPYHTVFILFWHKHVDLADSWLTARHADCMYCKPVLLIPPEQCGLRHDVASVMEGGQCEYNHDKKINSYHARMTLMELLQHS